MTDSLLFVLPDGRSAAIPARSAYLICDRLWGFGIRPGASLAAARITEALQRHPMYWRDVTFSPREVSPLLEASEIAPPSWSVVGDDPQDDLRARLLATCETLVETFNTRGDRTKLRALVADLERLRDRLRSS